MSSTESVLAEKYMILTTTALAFTLEMMGGEEEARKEWIALAQQGEVQLAMLDHNTHTHSD